jgi:hypothetical protein
MKPKNAKTNLFVSIQNVIGFKTIKKQTLEEQVEIKMAFGMNIAVDRFSIS